MALSKDASAPYSPSSAILSVLERSRDRGLPTTIDKDALLRMGVSESLTRRTLQSLQILDLINEDGSHTETLETLRAAPATEYKGKLAEWLNAAYADILQYVNPADGDETAVRDAFRPYKPHSMQERMITLFTGLFGAAGIWPESAQRARVDRPRARAHRQEKTPRRPPPSSRPLPAPLPVRQPAHLETIPEKALEYRLVDLMAEAADDPEVLGSIIKIITFLKTRDAAKPAKANSAQDTDEDE